MSAYGSLFERLAGDVDKRRGLSPVACAQASVAAHLAKMLSTRGGPRANRGPTTACPI